MPGDTIEVSVVVQNTKLVGGADRRHEVVLVREAVEAGRTPRELGVGLERRAGNVGNSRPTP